MVSLFFLAPGCLICVIQSTALLRCPCPCPATGFYVLRRRPGKEREKGRVVDDESFTNGRREGTLLRCGACLGRLERLRWRGLGGGGRGEDEVAGGGVLMKRLGRFERAEEEEEEEVRSLGEVCGFFLVGTGNGGVGTCRVVEGALFEHCCVCVCEPLRVRGLVSGLDGAFLGQACEIGKGGK